MLEDKKTKRRNKPNRMNDAGIMVILILSHSGGLRCFKHYYIGYVCKCLQSLFPRGEFMIHKTFQVLAERGKCSMGWFFGFKSRLIINGKGEILNFIFTLGNADDWEPLKQGNFPENINGKPCADKGYIGQALFEDLFLDGMQLVTKVKNSMGSSLMSIADKFLLRKRALIETVNDGLKNIAQTERSGHRSFNNFIASSLPAVAACCFFEKKPAIDLCFVKDSQLVCF